MNQIESADHDEEGFSLEFDSIFADVDLLDNPTTYTPSKHLSEIEGNISSENVELGSSCGSNIDQQPLTMTNNQGAISSTEKENLTAVSGFTSTNELSGRPPLENDPNMAPLLMGTPDLLDYSKDIINSESGAISSADRGQVHVQNQNLDLSKLHNIDAHSSGCEKINSGSPPIVNVNNIVNAPNLQQLGTISSFNPVLPGPPQQCPSLLDYAEFRSSAGTNWSNNINVYHANLINNQNLNMQPSMNPSSSSSSFQFQSSHYPSIGMNGRDTRSPFLNATVPVQQLTNQMGIPTAHVNGVVQSFHQESHHDPANMIYSYQYPNPNAYPENVPQVLDQHIPLSYGTRIKNQIVQNNNTNTNLFMDSINHQSLLYPAKPIFPPNTMITGVGVVNQIRPINTQQQAIFAPHELLNNGANYRPLANINNSRGYNWPQQLSSQHQQISSQVPSMANVVNYDPNCQYSMQLPGYSSTPPRPQNISYLRQVPVPPTTLYDPLVFNSMLQPDQVPFNPRPPQLSYHGQPINNIELPVATYYNSIMPASSISSRIPPVPLNGEQFNKKSPVMPMNMTVLDQQHYSNFNIAPHQRSFGSSTSNEPSNLPRFTCDNNQRQIEIMPNATDPDDHLRGSVMLRPSLLPRSQNEKRLVENGTGDVYGANYADSTHIQTEQREGGIQSARLAVTKQKNRSSPTKEQGTILGRRGRTRATKRQEVGESSTSMSSKRFRREVVVRKESSVTQEVIKFGSTQPQENNEAANSNVSSRPRTDSRKINNAVYDPSFEGMGLAVDPHLRE